MDGDGGKIKWTKNLELHLKNTGENALCLGMLHKSCEAKFSHKAMAIDLPVIVISTICGSLTLSAKSMFEPHEDIALKIVGVLILFSGVLGTIKSYFSYSRRAENHRGSYLEYSKLYRFVKVELGLPRESRIRPKDLLRLVNDSFERLNELSPLVPAAVLSSFTKKYKKSSIDRPPILNGLDEIGIYCESECTEDGIPPIVISPPPGMSMQANSISLVRSQTVPVMRTSTVPVENTQLTPTSTPYVIPGMGPVAAQSEENIVVNVDDLDL